MERLKKALETAEKQRQNSTTSGEMPSETKHEKKSVKTEQISYSQTRNIGVSEKLLKQNRVVAGFDDDPRSDLFKILRTKVLQRMQDQNSNLLAITSPTKGAGKSYSAINLAISIAMDANYSVLLVDLDLRSPSLHSYFGMPAEPGLSDYFSGEKKISELLVHPGLDKMVFLPAGSIIHRSSDLLTSPKMLELIGELKKRYTDRIVIVDLPPLLYTDDAMVFLPNVDACLLVVAEGENSLEEVQSSIQLIDEKKYIGSILNKSSEVISYYESYY